MYLDLNFAVINRSVTGVHSITLFFAAFDMMIATPSYRLPTYRPSLSRCMIVLPNDVVTRPLPGHR